MAKKQAEKKQQDLETGLIAEVRENLPDDFEDIVREYQESSAIASAWEKRKKEIGPIVEAACVLADKKYMIMPGYKVTQVKSKAPDRVAPERLIEKGVDWEIVQYATIKGVEYSYPMVTKIEEE